MGALNGRRRKQWDYYGARTGEVIKNEQHTTRFYSDSIASPSTATTIYTAPTNKRARILRWKAKSGIPADIRIGGSTWIYTDTTPVSGESSYEDAVIIQPGQALVFNSTSSKVYEFHIAEEDAGGGYLQ